MLTAIKPKRLNPSILVLLDAKPGELLLCDK